MESRRSYIIFFVEEYYNKRMTLKEGDTIIYMMRKIPQCLWSHVEVSFDKTPNPNCS